MSNSLTTTQARLRDDLRGVVTGDVSCSEAILQLYSTDGSMLQSRPLGVVYPKTAEDVSAVVKYASEMNLTVHSRGSGTETVGGSIGQGIILDFTRYMRKVFQVDDQTVTAGPGVNRERLNDIIKKTKNRFFAPSSGHFPTCTLGSILSVDCVGPRWLRHKFPHDYIKELEIVSGDGTIRTLRPETVVFDAGGTPVFKENSVYKDQPVWPDLIQLLCQNASLIAREQNGSVPECSGYRLEGVLKFKRPLSSAPLAGNRAIFDPARLVSGSEGSLGVITKAVLKTFPAPRNSGSVLLLFDSLDKAVRSIEAILSFEPTLCDMIDRRIINMIREWDRRFVTVLPSGAEIVLVVEFDTDTPEELNDRMNSLIHKLRDQLHLIFGSWFAFHRDEREMFRDLLRKSQGALLRIRPPYQAVSLLEDICVPIAVLPDFLHRIQAMLSAAGITYSLSGHVGQGQIRIQPLFDLTDSGFAASAVRLSKEIYSLVFSLGGSVGSASGTGLVRSFILPERYPALFPVFIQIKKMFDPDGRLNPGCVVPDLNADGFSNLKENGQLTAADERNKAYLFNRELNVDHHKKGIESVVLNTDARKSDPVVNSDNTRLNSDELKSNGPNDNSDNEEKQFGRDLVPWFDHLRGFSLSRAVTQADELNEKKPASRRQLEFQLKWDPRKIDLETFQCTGCGLCRIRTHETRMCPNFRLAAEEYAAPRAKANILRGILENRLPLEALTEDDVLRIGQECLFCHCCVNECPAQVNVPKLAFQIKSAWNAAHGMNLSDWFFSNIEPMMAFFSRIAPITNSAMEKPLFRWILDKLFGLRQTRKLPRISRSFLSQQNRKRQHQNKLLTRRQNKRVALFLDNYTNFVDPALADAAIKILEHNKVDVYVPDRQRSSGYSAFMSGNAYRAEVIAQRNTTVFVDLIRQGYEVVTVEPISAVCIRQEYPFVREDEETLLFGEHTTDLCGCLYQLHREGNLQLDFNPVPATVGYHAPCRTLALTGDSVASATPAEELLHLIPGLNVRRLERGCCGSSGIHGLKKENISRGVRLGRPLFLALRDSSISAGCSECNFCKLQMEQGADKPTIHPLKILAYAYGLGPDPFIGR